MERQEVLKMKTGLGEDVPDGGVSWFLGHFGIGIGRLVQFHGTASMLLLEVMPNLVLLLFEIVGMSPV